MKRATLETGIVDIPIMIQDTLVTEQDVETYDSDIYANRQSFVKAGQTYIAPVEIRVSKKHMPLLIIMATCNYTFEIKSKQFVLSDCMIAQTNSGDGSCKVLVKAFKVINHEAFT